MIKPDRAERGRGIEEPYDQDCIVISPLGGLARGEADGRARVAWQWRLVGRQFGRIAAVSQLFSVLLFPQLFSTLHCAFRSSPRWRFAGPPTAPVLSSSVPPRRESEPPLHGELFVIIAFPPANEAATTAEQITGKSILLVPLSECTEW